MYETVIEGVRWIPGRDKFLPDSHVYVIGLPDSDDLTLVDCGLTDAADYKLEQLDKMGVNFKHVRRIIMTHTHIDHIGCLSDMLKTLPDMEVWIHRNEAVPIEKGDTRIIFGNSMFGSLVKSQYAIGENDFNFKVNKKLDGGEDLELGGMRFKVLHVPGHSSGSIGLYNDENKLFMSGDTIYADGAIGRYDLESADPVELKRSLELIADLDINILLPCHNRIVKRDAAPMIRNTVQQWGPFLV